MRKKLEGYYGIIFLVVILATQKFDALLLVPFLLLLGYTILRFSKY